jgi:SWI/SNF-related matrix-associated actin-dependent regulator of chromatin subfamily A3
LLWNGKLVFPGSNAKPFLRNREKIPDLSVTLSDNLLRKNCRALDVVRGHNRALFLEDDSSLLGHLSENAARVLDVLSAEKNTHLQFTFFASRKHAPPAKAGGSLVAPTVTPHLSVILYGPLRIFEEVGEFLDECQIYLQDPKGCNRNVRYRNPHRLSGLSPDASWTIEQEIEESLVRCETLCRPVDYLAEVDSKQDLPETIAPYFLTTPLFK